MHELAIIISDLYLGDDARNGKSRPMDSISLPGLELAARFGNSREVDSGWRAWLARWLARPDLTAAPPAAIAACAVDARAAPTFAVEGHAPRDSSDPAATHAPPTSASHTPDAHAPQSLASPGTLWLATPVHLIASLTTLHLDQRSLLTLSSKDASQLAQDFNATFADSAFILKSVAYGSFLMQSHAQLKVATIEPARALASAVETSLATGPDAAVLRRLGAELEMWLHSHPVNEARTRRGELPVSTLWLWGGTPASTTSATSKSPTAAVTRTSRPAPDCSLFGSDDPYLAGLAQLTGLTPQPLPDTLGDILRGASTERAAVVTEVSPLLRTNPHWTVLEAVADLDRRYLSPAVSAVRAGAVSTLVIIANDRQLHLTRRDRLKFWRPARPGLTGLQT